MISEFFFETCVRLLVRSLHMRVQMDSSWKYGLYTCQNRAVISCRTVGVYICVLIIFQLGILISGNKNRYDSKNT